MAVKTDKTETEVQDRPGLLTPPRGGHQPFDGQAKSLTITRDINAQQLMDEVFDRLGGRDNHQLALVDKEDGTPRVLYVKGDVDMRTVRGVVDSHVPNLDHGLSDEQIRVERLKERLSGGEDLSGAELNQLLRAML